MIIIISRTLLSDRSRGTTDNNSTAKKLLTADINHDIDMKKISKQIFVKQKTSGET
jgi:hypothetical protein